jgi:hypothetical protein
MSDIKVGDLVMVVRDHACVPRVGHIYTVAGFGNNFHCRKCKEIFRGSVALLSAKNYQGPGPVGLPISWLKRIDPPAEGDSFTVKLPKKQPVEA